MNAAALAQALVALLPDGALQAALKTPGNPAADAAAVSSYELIPSADAIRGFMGIAANHSAYLRDSQNANIWQHKLIHHYTTVLETEYPELAAANGDVLPIDSSIDPEKTSYDYHLIDVGGAATWIDEAGSIVPTGFVTTKQFTGTLSNLGFSYAVNFFDIERSQATGFQLLSIHAKNAKRAHDAKKHYTWLFGDRSKKLVGLLNHPNIPITIAPLNAGTTSRLWDNKSNDEIIADINLVLDAIPRNTIRAHYAARLYMSLRLYQLLKGRRMGTGDGTLTLLKYLQDTWSGDDSGQGKVEFRVLNECGTTTATGQSLRLHPETLTDQSGLTGEILLAVPPEDRDAAAFLQARPFTQLAPQLVDFFTKFLSHGRIGGCKITKPLAFHAMHFLG